MPVLTNQGRLAVLASLMRDAETGVLDGLLKANVRAAVDGIDDYLDANAAAMNAAIPQPARGALTSKQKALLFTLVMRERFKIAP